jgi:uncharacterized 2Fe-2S/4Fe-4S cluster protein (DUF4445 family)
MPTITFQPSGVIAPCGDGETIFDVGRRHGVAIDTACVGKATCGLCRVKILAGEEHLNALTEAERKHLGNVYHITRVRLSCQTVVSGGDVVVNVTSRKRKSADR